MPQMYLLVVSKLMRSHDPLQLRVKVRKEIGVSEQYPIEKANIIKLHCVKHEKKPRKEGSKAEFMAYAIPRGKGPDKHQERKNRKQPAEDVRTAEAFLSVRDRCKILLRRGSKESLVLNEANSCV